MKAVSFFSSIGGMEFSRLPEKDKIPGRDIFSMLLPPDFNFPGKDKSGGEVVIKAGQLLSGIMDGGNLGGGAGLMLRQLHGCLSGPNRFLKN